MADRRISELTQITGANVDDDNDELVIVDASGGQTRAITRGELFKGIDGDITLSGNVDGRDVANDGSKLDGIESGATADQTASEIKTAYESNANTNAFTDSEKTRLNDKIGKQYETRAAFVTDVGGTYAPEDGTVVSAEGLLYVADSAATDISDLSGWRPFGDKWFIEHFGDPSSDALPVLQDLAAALKPGTTVSGLAREYASTWPADDTLEANRMVIVTDDVTFDFPKGTVFRDIPIYIKGTYGAEQNVGSAGFGADDKEINTGTSHGLSKDDYVQVLSQRNAYSPDAGEWQMGSINPTYNTLREVRLSEIHRVSGVPSSTTASLYGRILYDDYLDNTTGLSDPMTGVNSATIRKLTPVKNLTFRGIKFEYTSEFWTGIVARCAANLIVEKGGLVPSPDAGQAIALTDCIGFRYRDNYVWHEADGYSGSAWNSIRVAGGCCDTIISGNSFVGGGQVVDFTPSNQDNDIGASDAKPTSDFRTVQGMVVSGNYYLDAGDCFTTHPACFGLSVTGNTAISSGTFGRVRSRNNSITGNSTHTYNAGLAFSSYYEDTVVSGNTFMGTGSQSNWWGVQASPLGSETMNNNAIKRFVVSGNSFHGESGQTASGVRFRHYNNGSISSPIDPSFSLFTDAVKAGLSSYVITGNKFYDCGVDVEKWINGIHVEGNWFEGATYNGYYVEKADDGARLWCRDNYFPINQDAVYAGDEDSTLTYGYTTGNRVGGNFSNGTGIFSTPGVNNQNPEDFFSDMARVQTNGFRMSNGGSLKAVRGSGAATLYLDAEPEDGTSDAEIVLFGDTATTGTRTAKINKGGTEYALLDESDTQSDSEDTTSGALMPVGAFGLGSFTGGVLSQSDGNAELPCGFYGGNGSGSNFPGGAAAFRPFLALNRRASSSSYIAARMFIDSGAVPILRESTDSGVTWGDDNTLYGTANILGTVSQSGGTPTGAVIERGSNANGEYVRFADGTQICTYSGVLSYNGSSFTLSETWDYPALFSGRPTTSALAMDSRDGAASGGGSYNGSPVITLLTRTTGSNNLTLRATGATWVSGDEINVHLQATGRWF